MCPTAEMDPRIRRTRQQLFQAMGELLREKNFDSITVQDIAARSSLNRGTFYDHFTDKFALLEATVDDKFREIFSLRMAGAAGNCQGGVRQMILTVCDFLDGLIPCPQEKPLPFEPVIDSAIRSVVRGFLRKGLSLHGDRTPAQDIELRATAASWMICGTVMEWSRDRKIPAEQLADAVIPLVSGVLHLGKTESLSGD